MSKLLFSLIILIYSTQSWSHQLSDSYMVLDFTGGTIKEGVNATLKVAITDIELAIGIDSNKDSAITWGEIKNQEIAINTYVSNRIRFKNPNETCPFTIGTHSIENLSSGAFLSISLTLCPNVDSGNLELSYQLLFDIDAFHRGIIQIKTSSGSTSRVLTPDNNTLNINTRESGIFKNIIDFITQGIWHIWMGYDHLLFLIALLIPSVFKRDNGEWVAHLSAKPVAVDVMKIVTAFTLAHSLTLSLATLDIITPPAVLVETLIALSVVIAGINIIYPIFNNKRWLLALMFGFIHGFGFAGVLGGLALPSDGLILCLLAFNVGVELGQLAVVLTLLPMFYLSRYQNWYQNWGLKISAISISWIGIALVITHLNAYP